MRKKFYILTLFFAILGFISTAQTAEEWFQNGNMAYTNAAYKKALEAYHKALETGEHSAALYYNLGNTYYRLNEVAESIYYFEKGLILKPQDPDLSNNILFAKNMTLDAIEKLPQTQITAFNNKLMGMMNTNQWAWLTLLLVWLFSILLIIYLWIQSSKSKKQLFVSALVLGLLGVVSYTITSTKYMKLHSEQFGIVFSEVIQVNNEPNQRSEVQFILHEGTKVQILEQFQDWQKIRIANGAEGWVSGAMIREL